MAEPSGAPSMYASPFFPLHVVRYLDEVGAFRRVRVLH